jgi:hypothetical protein
LRVWLGIPQPAKWQRIGNKIDTAMMFVQSNLVNVFRAGHLVPVSGWPFSFLKHKRLIYYQRGGAKTQPIEDPFLPSEIHSPQPKNQAN